MKRLTRTLSSYLGTKVNGSEVTRTLWMLAIRSQYEFAAIFVRQTKISSPSNGDELGSALFEDHTMNIIRRKIIAAS